MRFKKLDSLFIETAKQYHKNIDYVDFFNSKVQCLNEQMYYSIHAGGLYICKVSNIMGQYSIILYTYPVGNDSNIQLLKSKGISIRSSLIAGQKDSFGQEYLYNADKFVQMQGPEFRYHRNILKRFKTTFEEGNSEHVADIVENWTKIRGEKHQLKLYKTVLNNLNLLHITTTFYNGTPIGFSIVEKINDKFGIILQRLINPTGAAYETKEPNFLLHFNDCIQHKNMVLNMGSCVGIKNMQVSKDKLIPENMQTINRQKGDIKITKDFFEYFKQGGEI